MATKNNAKKKPTKPAPKSAKKPTKPAPKPTKGKPAKPAPKPTKVKTQTVRAMIEVELPAVKGLNNLLTKAAFGKNFALIAASGAAKLLGVAKPIFAITALKGAAPGADEEEE